MSLIPFANPHAAYLARRSEILDAVTRVCDSGWYILGEEVARFERQFAEWCDRAHCLGVANGTDAIELCLRGLGVGAGQAVFTVSHTAVATVAAIERAGAVPVLVDIDPVYGTMDPTSLARSIDHVQTVCPQLRLGAVVAVHIYGHPCDIEALLEISDAHHMPLIEDCAQAHGALYKGKRVGTFGRAASFSFYPTKNLGTIGDAGAICTADADLDDALRALHQYGWRERYISAESGINSRMDPLHAAILGVHLPCLDDDVRCRQTIAARYDKALADSGLQAPAVAPWAAHAYHLYVVRTGNRQAFMEFMKARGVGTALHYPAPVHSQPAYVRAAAEKRLFVDPAGLPCTEALYGDIVSLPMFPQLTEQAVDTVCHALATWREAK